MLKKYISTALVILFIFLLPFSQLFAKERNSGDKMKLPETTEFAKKVNKFLEPVSFGVGTEPGYDKNSIYLYLMCDYHDDYSWMVKLKIENNVNSDNTLEVSDSSEDDKYLQINKSKAYELFIQPWIRHFDYFDFGLGVFMGYYQDNLEGVHNSGSEGIFLDGRERMFYLGPLVTFQLEYPIASHLDVGLISELIPIGAVLYDYDGEYSIYVREGVTKKDDSERLNGFCAPYVGQKLYFTFLKFLNLSTSVSYGYTNIGNGDVVIHDAIWRCGASILKRPKSGFLNFLVGIYYENEWMWNGRLDNHNLTHDKRWLFCLGASG